MSTILVSFIFIFFKINLMFVDPGVVFYITNFVGFLMLYVGVKKVQDQIALKKAKPLIIIMIFHSVLFLLLNGAGISYNAFTISDPYERAIAWTIVIVAVIGMIITLRIMFLFTKSVKDAISMEKQHVFFINRIMELILLTFVIAGICFLFIQVFWTFTMAVHLMFIAYLIVELYRVVDKHVEANTLYID